MNHTRETYLSVDRMLNEGLGGGQIYYNCDVTKFEPVVWDAKITDGGVSREYFDVAND